MPKRTRFDAQHTEHSRCFFTLLLQTILNVLQEVVDNLLSVVTNLGCLVSHPHVTHNPWNIRGVHHNLGRIVKRLCKQTGITIQFHSIYESLCNVAE